MFHGVSFPYGFWFNPLLDTISARALLYWQWGGVRRLRVVSGKPQGQTQATSLNGRLLFPAPDRPPCPGGVAQIDHVARELPVQEVARQQILPCYR
jgi:hypothetical protein